MGSKLRDQVQRLARVSGERSPSKLLEFQQAQQQADHRLAHRHGEEWCLWEGCGGSCQLVMEYQSKCLESFSFSHLVRNNLRGCQSRIVSLVTAPTIFRAFNWAKSGRVFVPMLRERQVSITRIHPLCGIGSTYVSSTSFRRSFQTWGFRASS